ncbi:MULTISPECIES: hypothetical protein [Flavobacterium]|uniref:Uncharacterized protein n=2 Tax=Flavobacterium TaxID=237 RepID=A0A1S1J9V8_9FLAO|nr:MULTISPECIES: hypothetical protein [Flavobacterium]MCC9018088.1 hypothetical protein [Flavobacterium sp. F-126]OHT46235.1 hypothetical protein BHE19_01615 [Flavobacterium tructae]OXB22194.1 hypothetical protein B0A71_01640 [Flavobacterium tructae]
MIVDDFKNHCINNKCDIVVQKCLIEDTSYFFNEIAIGEEFNFKKDIANILNVHIRDIVIVGSGKLGFSLKPDNSNTGLYLFKEFDHNFNYSKKGKKSDLDVAIISSHLFDSEIKNLYDHTNHYDTDNLWADRNSFAKYVLKGKLAIRFLPIEFPLTKGVLQVQEKYKMNYGREVNLEIYKSWHFFETYHQENIKKIQVNLIS